MQNVKERSKEEQKKTKQQQQQQQQQQHKQQIIAKEKILSLTSVFEETFRFRCFSQLLSTLPPSPLPPSLLPLSGTILTHTRWFKMFETYLSSFDAEFSVPKLSERWWTIFVSSSFGKLAESRFRFLRKTNNTHRTNNNKKNQKIKQNKKTQKKNKINKKKLKKKN